MIKKINIFNYEAYYLDYLEGNLSEEDTAGLLDFLDKHPDLKMVEEELPTFTTDEVSLGNLDFLKEADDEDPITEKNVEHFLISKHEAVLSKEKEEELEVFIAGNPAAAKDDQLFGAVYFTPDKAVVMTGKADLKKKAPVVLWPYYSGVAAAVIAVFFFLYNPAPTVGIESVKFAQNDSDSVTSKQNKAASQQEILETKVFSPNKNLFTSSEPSISSTAVEKEQEKQNLVEETVILNNQPSRPMVAALDNKEISPISTIYTNPIESTSSGQDVAYTDVNQTQNPIEPITKFISEKTNTEVDFRQPKSKKKKGFFVKIGKFELERK